MAKNNNSLISVRLLACTLLTFMLSAHVAAQHGRTNHAHVGIIYPLSTNGKTAASDTNKFSLHLLAGISQQEDALLIAGISGIVKGNAYGTLVSGISNHVGKEADGVQVAGILNHIDGRAQGVQIAGLVNSTGNAQGLQIAGLMNKAGNANTQVAGLINVAKKVKGAQIAGLINIAEESDYPIGILNIIKEGEMQLGLATDEGGNAMVTLRSGGKVMYGLLGIGYHFGYEEARYVIEAGLGAHLITAKAFRLNAELASAAMTNFEEGVYGRQSLRVLAGYRIVPRFEVFAGPTFNHLMFENDQPDIRDNRYLWTSHGDDVFNGFYLGGIVGVQFSL
ncbi:hypothetical protein [Parapedobacter indicus]|uniref:Uncharacterized protein n=1 Tax=Parapedobacter indicus TaxID=1477437 RepID=A0A1I3Q5K8_9SPHI|nr:hypothetical protein [Parapedobacter indicus]PPL00678.1 hypothetical protein CLV26_108270 [Parapedobacter indicus]SFJ28975.1 hypothetical protein SAMN05444682_108269 [Parapedobacter indicus]